MTPPTPLPDTMEHTLERVLTDGSLVQFESAPIGFPKADGEPRPKDHRAYYVTPPGPCPFCDGSGREPGKRPGTTRKCPPCQGSGQPNRKRVTSVTTLLDQILPKPGLVPWAEGNGILGAVEAIRRGLIDLEDYDLDVVRAVRDAGLGADQARDLAASRGLNLHDVAEEWMRTGSVPNPADHLPEHRGFLRGFASWVLTHDPEPVAVEQLVAHPRAGYAGRSDLVARIDGVLTRVDYKTSDKGGIFNAAHVQVRLYEDAERASGGNLCKQLLVVSFDASGGFREMECLASSEMARSALEFARALQPVTSACDAGNAAEREARRALEAA